MFLSDWTLSLAVLHFGWDQGPGLDFRGVHHFGVLVEDVEKITGKIEELGAKFSPSGRRGKRASMKPKFCGPDKVIFDIADHPWRGSAPLEAK